MTNSETKKMLEGQGLACTCDLEGKVTAITVQDMDNDSSYELYDIPDKLDLIIPQGMKRLGWEDSFISSGPFFASRIKSVQLPDSLEYIGPYAFFDSELKSVMIPSNVKEIGEDCFSHSDLESITFLNPDIILGEYCLPGGFISSLQEIRIPQGSMDKFKSKLPEDYWPLLKERIFS